MCTASERVHLKNQLHNFNRPFAQWCLLTTKTRIHFVSSFILIYFKFGNPMASEV